MFNSFSVQVDLRPHFEKHWSSFNRSDATRSFQRWLEPPAMVSSPAHKTAHFILASSPLFSTQVSLCLLYHLVLSSEATQKSQISLLLWWPFLYFFILLLLLLFFFFHFLALLRTCEILVRHTGIEPMLPALEAQIPNHWTIKEDPIFLI